MAFSESLCKPHDDTQALAKAFPAGARWIKVRPYGLGTTRHAAMIQPRGDGALRVIGGAGGKLNYLKLAAVRSGANALRSNGGRPSARPRRQRQPVPAASLAW